MPFYAMALTNIVNLKRVDMLTFEHISKIPWRSLETCLSCEAKLNAAFEELSHYDLKDPNDFAEFLITANIGLVRAKFPDAFSLHNPQYHRFVVNMCPF